MYGVRKLRGIVQGGARWFLVKGRGKERWRLNFFLVAAEQAAFVKRNKKGCHDVYGEQTSNKFDCAILCQHGLLLILRLFLYK